MRRRTRWPALLVCVFLLLGASDSSCSSSDSDSGTPKPTKPAATATKPAATATTAPEPTATTAPLAPTDTLATSNTVEFLEVNGAVAGSSASVVVQTQPGASCRLSYTTPAGTDSEAEGLGDATADDSGIVRWNWIIGTNTSPGEGTVRVRCGDASASNAISIAIE